MHSGYFHGEDIDYKTDRVNSLNDEREEKIFLLALHFASLAVIELNGGDISLIDSGDLPPHPGPFLTVEWRDAGLSEKFPEAVLDRFYDEEIAPEEAAKNKTMKESINTIERNMINGVPWKAKERMMKAEIKNVVEHIVPGLTASQRKKIEEMEKSEAKKGKTEKSKKSTKTPKIVRKTADELRELGALPPIKTKVIGSISDPFEDKGWS